MPTQHLGSSGSACRLFGVMRMRFELSWIMHLRQEAGVSGWHILQEYLVLCMYKSNLIQSFFGRGMVVKTTNKL
jgi:hypothetical protein